MSKISSGPRSTKTGQSSLCNKVFWTDDSKFEIFSKIGESMSGEELLKELQPPVSS